MSLLFEPTSIGPLRLTNRLVMTAMSTCFAEPGGIVSDRLIEYYAARAAAGVGLVTVEEAYIHPQLPHVKNALGIFGDHHILGLQRVTRRIHENGSRASLQIGLYFREAFNGFPRYAASVDAPDCDDGCKELTPEEIIYLADLFADAAERADRAGFDAVEIHACHGCLVSEFLSPYWNSRTDEYGGSQQGRFRFALDVLVKIRARLGEDYPVLFRISGSEFTPEGFTPEDAVALSMALEASGVSAINVSGGLGHENHVAIPPGDVARGLLLPIGKRIRSEVNVPVIVGNSMTPEMAAEAVSSGMADLIGLGRPLIADPEWPKKVREGRTNEIRHCLRCNQGCFGALWDARRPHIRCLYNPGVGLEAEGEIPEAETSKYVVVIGGGPAGCEAARVAKIRGHHVVLIEKSDRLGGQIHLAAVPPAKGDFQKMTAFYAGELDRLQVDVRLGTEATTELLQSLGADAYVFAVGANPVKPAIPGVDLPHVTTARDVLSGNTTLPPGPVVVAGGGASGLETADMIANDDHSVTIVEILDHVGRDMQAGIGVREGLLARLTEKHVQIYTGHRLLSIEPDSAVLSDRPLMGGGNQTRVPANCVVLALGMRSALTDPIPVLSEQAAVYRVGDCCNPGNAMQAIHQAYDLAMAI